MSHIDDRIIDLVRTALDLEYYGENLYRHWAEQTQNAGGKAMFLRLAERNKMAVPFISYFNFLLSPIIILVRLASRLPFLSRLGQYDSKLNYQLAYKKNTNSLLRFIFVSEIKMLKLIRYPIGISIAVKMRKP